MPKVTEAHRASRREQITAAALACFAEKGFQRTSMADIIAASGLSAGAIYSHFESKQQIVLAVGKRVLSRRIGELGEMAGGDQLPDPIASVRMLMSGFTEDRLDTRLLLQLWGEATTDPEMLHLVGQIFGELRDAYLPYLAAWAARHGVGDPEAWATRALPAVLAFAQGFLVQRTLLPGFDADTYFAAVRTVAGPGLLSPEA